MGIYQSVRRPELPLIEVLLYMYTVEFPNNGHVGDMASVRCRGLSASRSVRFAKLHCIYNSQKKLYVHHKLNRLFFFYLSTEQLVRIQNTNRYC